MLQYPSSHLSANCAQQSQLAPRSSFVKSTLIMQMSPGQGLAAVEAPRAGQSTTPKPAGKGQTAKIIPKVICLLGKSMRLSLPGFHGNGRTGKGKGRERDVPALETPLAMSLCHLWKQDRGEMSKRKL